jgi:Xaa-Pro aminopeptidase
MILGDFAFLARVAGPGAVGRVSRALGEPNAEVSRMLEAEDASRWRSLRSVPARRLDVHRAVSKGFTDRGYHLGHDGPSIGMTMIEHPKIGEGVETEIRENMVFSMHPHVIADNGVDCLYMQDTWLVTADGGEPLAGLPMRIFRAGESRA